MTDKQIAVFHFAALGVVYPAGPSRHYGADCTRSIVVRPEVLIQANVTAQDMTWQKSKKKQ